MASFCFFCARFSLFHTIPWELFCTHGNCRFRIVVANKTKHKRTTEGNDSHGYRHYSCPVDIRHFPIHEVLDGRHGKSCPIAYCGKLGVAKSQPRAKRRSYHLHQIRYGIRACSASFFDLLFVIRLSPCRCVWSRKAPVLEYGAFGIAARQLRQGCCNQAGACDSNLVWRKLRGGCHALPSLCGRVRQSGKARIAVQSKQRVWTAAFLLGGNHGSRSKRIGAVNCACGP